MKIKLKDQYKNEVIGFNNSSAPLKNRSDLYLLAITALESRDSTLLNLFERLPKLEELKNYKTKIQLDALK